MDFQDYVAGCSLVKLGRRLWKDFDDIEQGVIDQSNDMFSSILSKYIDEPMDALYQSLLNEYEVVARNNPIARFNLERITTCF